MNRPDFMTATKRAAAAVVSMALAAPVHAETEVGTTIESRVLLGFKADDAAIAEMLPDGWVSFTLPRGPVSGSNLIVALIDRHLSLGPDGTPDPGAAGPTVAFLAYARKDGVEGVRGFVTRVYEEPPMYDPYGTSVPADISRVAGISYMGGGVRRQTETWTIEPESGGALQFDLDVEVGPYGWSTGGESRPYSSENPDFFRIYRYDQLATLMMNTAMGRGLNGTASFTVTDPDVAGLFGGSDALVSIISVPTYVREISLP